MNSTPDASRDPRRSDSGRIPFLSRLIATGFYSGYSPVASGTAGSAVGVLLYLIPGMSNPLVLAAGIIAGYFAGAVTARHVAEVSGHQVNRDAQAMKNLFQNGAAEHPDPSIVVIDEIVGMWISLLFLPPRWDVILGAFIAFRIFDTIKPWPAGRLERVPKGHGIMLDDVAAGCYANVVIRILLLLPWWRPG